MPDNFERMMQLVTEFFDTKNDPDQIGVTEADRDKLMAIHTATMSELADENGPVVWILLIPTTTEIMQQFISGAISENQLLQRTPVDTKYEAIYLCSASVLPEHRHKGLAKQLTMEAMEDIRKTHPVHTLFYWPFSDEGKALAQSVARSAGLSLLEKQ